VGQTKLPKAAGIPLSLAKEGAAVAVNYASDRKGADRVVERIKAAGGKAIAVQEIQMGTERIGTGKSASVLLNRL
jgi:3-oxoacyl-[acyl-carrier protein] reductase